METFGRQKSIFGTVDVILSKLQTNKIQNSATILISKAVAEKAAYL
ncbi:hypothetical protein [Listeria ivanovii]|nr:hypothetical protein [Listeria ivanovii]